jgi:hypothetical protein
MKDELKGALADAWAEERRFVGHPLGHIADFREARGDPVEAERLHTRAAAILASLGRDG